MKKVVSVLLALMMLMSTLVVGTVSVSAASYNAAAAVEYANAHWNDGVGLCAEFVSKCLKAGGITIPSNAGYTSSTQSYQNNSGTLDAYTNPYTCSAAQLLYLSKSYTVIKDPTDSQIAVGDIVFMKNSSGYRDGHVGICIKKSSGKAIYAAHNKATNSGQFSSGYPCTYVVKMGGHIHDYAGEGNEQLHPHKIYRICECGDWYYTGATTKRTDCLECYPTTLKVYFNANGASISSDTYKLSSDLVYNKSDSTKYYQPWVYNNTKTNGLVNYSTFGLYKTGHSFTGWGTKASGGTVFDQGDNTLRATDINANIKNGDCSSTLYAQWRPNVLSVYYNANGASITSDTYKISSNLLYNKADGTKAVQKWDYGKTRENGLINCGTFGLYKTGYTFTGWGTKASGGTVYSQSDNTLTAVNFNSNIKNGDCSTTLYAQWKANSLTVNYHINGGSISSEKYKLNSSILSYISTNEKVNDVWTYNATHENGLYNPGTFGIYKTGYKFSGWGTTSTGGSVFDQNNVDLKPTDINSNIKNGNCASTLYAQWTANSYNIAFNGNGSTSGSMSNLTMAYGTAKALTANAFKKTGYTFAGWNTKADGTGTAYADKASVKNLTATNGGTVTLYAQWKANSYSVAFNGNGSTSGSMSNLTMAYGTAKALTANAFKKTGYTFTGWNTKADGTGTAYADKASAKNLTATNGGTVTLYAQWKANSYSVAFNGNGSTSGSMSNLTMAYGTAKALTANAFKKTGYTFAGWNTKADGTGTTYADKASVKNLTATNGGTVTLYAQWEEIKYTVNFNANSGSVDTSSAVVTYGNSVSLPTPSKAYTVSYNANGGSGTPAAQVFDVECLGWSANSSASAAEYLCDDSYTPLGNATLYAVWESSLSKIITYTTPTRSGYTFLGWSESDTATEATYASGEKITISGDKTLYAVWQKIDNSSDTTEVIYKTVKLDYKEEYQIKINDLESGRYVPEKDSTVLTVDSDGTVTATSVGSSTVYVYDSDNHLRAVYTFEVEYAAWQRLIIIFLFGWIWYI